MAIACLALGLSHGMIGFTPVLLLLRGLSDPMIEGAGAMVQWLKLAAWIVRDRRF